MTAPRSPRPEVARDAAASRSATPATRVVGEGMARLDIDRARRRGYPEAVYCEFKTPTQLSEIAAAVRGAEHPVIFTRASEEQAEAILAELPSALRLPEARMVCYPPTPPAPVGETVLVVCAGTSDLPVAREAETTARFLGRATTLLTDVGIAGIHRLLEHEEELNAAGAVIVVAGMDGALPGVVAGLIAAPVVAVPTSVGYGAGAGGIAPLLTMLNSCAPGVGVVNIDNGYGAGHLAAQITAPRGPAPASPPR